MNIIETFGIILLSMLVLVIVAVLSGSIALRWMK